MPSWLVQLLIGIAVKLLERYAQRLTDSHQEQLEGVLEAAPLKADPNPPPMQSNNPNLGKGHFGG